MEREKRGAILLTLMKAEGVYAISRWLRHMIEHDYIMNGMCRR